MLLQDKLQSMFLNIKQVVEDNGEYPRIGRVGSHSIRIGISFYFLGCSSSFAKTMYSI